MPTATSSRTSRCRRARGPGAWRARLAMPSVERGSTRRGPRRTAPWPPASSAAAGAGSSPARTAAMTGSATVVAPAAWRASTRASSARRSGSAEQVLRSALWADVRRHAARRCRAQEGLGRGEDVAAEPGLLVDQGASEVWSIVYAGSPLVDELVAGASARRRWRQRRWRPAPAAGRRARRRSATTRWRRVQPAADACRAHRPPRPRQQHERRVVDGRPARAADHGLDQPSSSSSPRARAARGGSASSS